MDRVADTNAALYAEISALNRWANRIDRDPTEIHATQAARQRAIDALVKRWTSTPPEA